MALTDNGGGLSAADIAAVTGGNNGFGFGGDGSWWIIILFLFAFCNGGWGNGWGNGGMNMLPWMMNGQQNTNNDIQRVIDQQSVMGGIAGLNQGMNAIAMSLQNCCCENRAATADLKYTVATEACADRNAVTSALQQVIASNTANTQAILDKLCQQEIDALKAQNENLRTQLNMANLAASQTGQTAQILADNAAQTATLRQALNPTPIPAYVVQNPSCCNNGYFNGCGCNGVA